MASVAHRAVWGVADQALSSLTNFGLGMVVARSVTARSFGAFSLAFAAYAVVLNVANGLISEPFLVRYSNVDEQTWRRAAAAACGTGVALGAAAGVVCLLVSLLVRAEVAAAFLALAVALPGLVMQNTWRTLFFARQKGRTSFLNGMMWVIVLFPTLAVLSWTGQATVFRLVLAWGLGGTAAATLGCLQARTCPKPLETGRWLREHRRLASRFLAELLVFSGVQQLTMYAIGAVAGLVTVAGIRGAEILLGPVYVMIFGVRVMAIPEAIEMLKQSVSKMRSVLYVVAFGLGTVSLASGALLSLLPEQLGAALLGESWAQARPAVMPMALFMAGLSASVSALIGLRALAAAERSLRARICSAPLLLLGGTTGAMYGARGAALGMAIGVWIAVIIWWRELKHALREHLAEQRAGAR